MFFLKPFKNKATRGEAGNMLLITGMIASAIAVTGGKIMLDRSTAQRKANQMAQSMKQAKEIPGSAAMIAKALISLPPHVAEKRALEWTTEKLISAPTNSTNMPLVYPLPYLSGAIGAPAQPANSVEKTRDPPAGANWGNFAKDGTLSATVRVFTNDRTQASAQDVNRVMGSKSVTGGSEEIKRTESTVTYVFRNCDSEGKTSPSFTGIYCASANIKSDNYAGPLDANGKPTTVNEANAELGSITPPPSPECGVISSSSPKVKAGESFALVVNVKGVAVGYNVRLVSPAVPLADQTLKGTETNKISLPWNDPRFERPYTISNIPTSKVASALVTSGANEMVLDVDLTAADGQVKTCSGVRVQLDKPIVSCEVGSLDVERTGVYKRNCRVELRRDNGAGIVTQVRVEQINKTTGVKTVKNFAPNFSGSKWQDFVDCEQDGWTFNTFLVRENPAGTPKGESQCSPEKLIDELPTECDAKSIANKDPARRPSPPISNLLLCNVKVVRTPTSHTDAKVWIDGADKDSSGTWASNEWTGVVPCAKDATKITAELRKGSSTSDCWTKDIDAVDQAQCTANSTRVHRDTTSSQCYVTLSRNVAGSEFVDVRINGALMNGNWSGFDWKSNLSPCLADGADYQANLTDATGAVSDCGTDKLIKKSYCLDMKVFRRPNPSKCEMTIDKDPALLTSKIKSVNKNVVTGGSWTGNKWKSAIFNCSLNAVNFDASITQKDNSVELCPSFSLPVAAPVCHSIVAARQVANPSKCLVTMRKGALSGAISTAIINGTPIAFTDQGVYQTTVDCPLTGETLITGSVSNASGTDSCNDFKMWTNLVGTHMGTGVVKCAWQTQVRVNGGKWFSVGGNRFIGDLNVAISTDQGFKAPPFCNLMEVRAVGVSGGFWDDCAGKVLALPGGGCGGTGSNLGNGSYQFSNQDNICDGNTDINTKIYINPASLKYKVTAIAGKGSCP